MCPEIRAKIHVNALSCAKPIDLVIYLVLAFPLYSAIKCLLAEVSIYSSSTPSVTSGMYAMRNVMSQLMLVTASPVFGAYSYWFDESCRSEGKEGFIMGFSGARDMARRGLRRLRDENDVYQAAVFQRIFKTNKTANAERAVDKTEGILRAFSEMKITFTRNKANYRYYCDNDEQSLEGASRWKLRADPPGLPPETYIRQTDRPRLPPVEDRTIQYQEWVDMENGIFMGESMGCQTPSTINDRTVLVLAEAYNIQRLPYPTVRLPGIPIRATVTICNRLLFGTLHSFEDLPAALDLGMLLWTPQISNLDPARVLEPSLDSLRQMTAFAILHEFCHFPPWRVDDIQSPDQDDDVRALRAYSWADVQDIRSTFWSVRNVNNFVFYALLAKLADRDFRLSTNEEEAHAGVLDYVGRTMQLPSPKRGVETRMRNGQSSSPDGALSMD